MKHFNNKTFLCFILTVCFSSSGFAATPNILKILENDLNAHINKKISGSSFENLIKKWSISPGVSAVPWLIKIASQSKYDDSHRYVALMGAAKLGGEVVLPSVIGFLQSPRWMLRSGALKILAFLKSEVYVKKVFPLLMDPALVVRLDALEVIHKIKPKESAEVLLQALRNKNNYRNGKAEWVPLKALDVLVEIDSTNHAPDIVFLLDYKKDQKLQEKTIWALERLTGKVLKPGASILEKVQAWKTYPDFNLNRKKSVN